MYLQILENGRVKYKRQTRFATTEITAPIKEFQGDHFVVGFAFIKTRFEVSEPPHQEGGGWSMVVDGVRLTRSNASAIYESRIEREYDDIVKSVFLGQVYPSGNIYLRTFDEIAGDSFFWPGSITYHSLMSNHHTAVKFGDASFVKTMKDPRERTRYGYRILPVYIPYEEGMQDDVCNPTRELKEGPVKKYLDSGDFFDSAFYHCDVNDSVAVYTCAPNKRFSFQVVAFPKELEIENPNLLLGLTKRPLTLEERKAVQRQKEEVKSLDEKGECTTVARFLDEARQFFTADIKGSDLRIRISMYQSPGCAGHLARYYILDILRGNTPLKTAELVKVEGVI